MPNSDNLARHRDRAKPCLKPQLCPDRVHLPASEHLVLTQAAGQFQTAIEAPPTMQVRHLTQLDLARRWRVSVRTLEAWRWRKTGPNYLKLRGRVVYRLKDIEKFEKTRVRG